METKRPPAIRHLAAKDTLPIIKVFYEFNHLKSLFRQGWLHHGIPRDQCETVAEHTLGVVLLSLFLADAHFPRLDRTKVMLLSLLHDFGEIYAGDIVPGRVSLTEKHQREQASVEQVFARLPRGAEYLALWQEYEAGSSPEARFVKEIDRLEMGMQAGIYEMETPQDLSLFFESTDKALTTPELRDIFAALLQLRPSRTSKKEQANP